MNEYFNVSNERKGGLYIDLLMTVRYSHEAWEGHICSVNSHEAWKGSYLFGEKS